MRWRPHGPRLGRSSQGRGDGVGPASHGGLGHGLGLGAKPGPTPPRAPRAAEASGALQVSSRSGHKPWSRIHLLGHLPPPPTDSTALWAAAKARGTSSSHPARAPHHRGLQTLQLHTTFTCSAAPEKGARSVFRVSLNTLGKLAIEKDSNWLRVNPDFSKSGLKKTMCIFPTFLHVNLLRSLATKSLCHLNRLPSPVGRTG